VSLNTKHGFPVFSTVIEANSITKRSDLGTSFLITEEDERTIRDLARDPRIGERVQFSIFHFSH
jgi:DNA replication licensing factor MCM2